MTIISETVKKYPLVKIKSKSIIGDYTILGYPCSISECSFKSKKDRSKTTIGNNCVIGSNVVIYEGTKIGDNTRVEDFCRIGENVTIGKQCRIFNGERIYADTKIGNDSKVGGYCCEGSIIGNHVRHFGALIHRQEDPTLPWDTTTEKSPQIDDNVFIGFGAIIIGDVHIYHRVFIAAGAIVTEDVPSKHIVIRGEKNPIYYENWKGKLRNSPMFKTGML
jgi:acetyltransferase-like isoleucine patch superfamily enzyme